MKTFVTQEHQWILLQRRASERPTRGEIALVATGVFVSEDVEHRPTPNRPFEEKYDHSTEVDGTPIGFP